MKVVEFDFIANSPWQFCSKALSMYRDGALEGYVETAPTLDLAGGAASNWTNRDSPATTPPATMLTPTYTPTPTAPPAPVAGEIWHPLSEFEYQEDVSLAEIMFPDNSRVAFKNWTQTKRDIDPMAHKRRASSTFAH